MSGLQNFEEVSNLFRGGEPFHWETHEVMREIVGEAWIGKKWAGIMASRNELISSTIYQFCLKHYLISCIATARAVAETL